MKPALACSVALVSLSLLSLPAAAAPASSFRSTAGVVPSVPDRQAASPKKKAVAKRAGKAKKARPAAGKK